LALEARRAQVENEKQQQQQQHESRKQKALLSSSVSHCLHFDIITIYYIENEANSLLDATSQAPLRVREKELEAIRVNENIKGMKTHNISFLGTLHGRRAQAKKNASIERSKVCF
jgi:hypothetical protein